MLITSRSLRHLQAVWKSSLLVQSKWEKGTDIDAQLFSMGKGAEATQQIPKIIKHFTRSYIQRNVQFFNMYRSYLK